MYGVTSPAEYVGQSYVFVRGWQAEEEVVSGPVMKLSEEIESTTSFGGSHHPDEISGYSVGSLMDDRSGGAEKCLNLLIKICRDTATTSCRAELNKSQTSKPTVPSTEGEY